MRLEFILENIESAMCGEGYVNTLSSSELRKYEWEKWDNGVKKVVLLMNAPMTEMRITMVDPSII